MSDNDLIRRKDAMDIQITPREFVFDCGEAYVPVAAVHEFINNIPAAPHEMTAREFVYEHQRLELWCIGRRCDACEYFMQCPINRADLTTKEMSEKLPLFVEKWAAEHPEKKRKTYAEDFFEKFPKAQRQFNEEQTMCRPLGCRKNIYGIKEPCTGRTCISCWNEEVEDEDE